VAIPDSITAITVSGSFLGADGSARSGYVTFTPSVVGNTEGVILPVAATKVELDENGAFEVDLMATDDPDWEAPDFTYEVTETICGSVKTTRTYNIEVPAASPDGALDLALVAPVSTPGTPTNYLLLSGGTMTGLLISHNLQHAGTTLGFYGHAVGTKPTVTGSRGSNAALASLLTALANLGLITDSSS
jgi:hypothetical protein